MKQSRIASLVETFGGTALGFVVSLLVQAGVNWYYSLPLSGLQSVNIILIFTVVSLVRGYFWRRFCEAFHIRTPISPAMQAIIAERARQRSVEGWDDAHDDTEHATGDLALAAAAYAGMPAERELAAGGGDEVDLSPPDFWPWRATWWKPQNNRRDLVRAGALIVAELEREDRGRRRRK